MLNQWSSWAVVNIPITLTNPVVSANALFSIITSG
jgi:hypothetical protein